MKFSFASTLFFAASALAYATDISFQVNLGPFDGEIVSLPWRTQRNRIYVEHNSNDWLVTNELYDKETGTSTLHNGDQYVNVDADGFLCMADTGYPFKDILESPDNELIFINGTDTFYLVANDIGSYDIKVLGVAPEGSIPIQLGQVLVGITIKRDNAATTMLTKYIN